MLADTHTQRILDLASQKGLLRASDLDAIDALRVVLTRLTDYTKSDPNKMWPCGSRTG